MADNELIIRLVLQTGEADAADTAYNERVKSRAKSTAKELEKIDKERNYNMNQASREFLRQTDADYKAFTKARETEARDLAKKLKQIDDSALAQKKAVTREVIADIKRSLNEEAKEKTEVHAKGKKMLDEFNAKDKSIRADIAQREKSANDIVRGHLKEATEAVKQSLREEAKEKTEVHAQGKRLLRDQVANQKEIDRFMERARKDEARDQAQMHNQVRKSQLERIRDGKEEEKSIMNVARAYTSLRIASEVGQAISYVMHLTADEAGRVRDYVEGVVASMRVLRDKLVEVMNLRGQGPPTGWDAAKYAREASGLGLTTDELLKVEAGVRGGSQIAVMTPEVEKQYDVAQAAGGMLGTAKEIAKGYKARPANYDRLWKLVIPWAMRTLGISADAAVEAFNAVIMTQTVDPKTGLIDEKQFLADYSTMIQKARIAPASTRLELMQMSRVLREGQVEPEKREQFMNESVVAAGFMGPQQFTYWRQFQQSIAKMPQDKMDELGITPNMSAREISKHLITAWEVAEKSGEDTTIRREMGKYFPNVRAASIAAFYKGAEQRGEFQRAERIKGTAADIVPGAAQRTETSKDAAIKSAKESAQAEAGQRGVDWTRLVEQGIVDATADKTYETQQSAYEAALTQAGKQYHQGDYEKQEGLRRAALALKTGLVGITTGGTPAQKAAAEKALDPFTSNEIPWWKKILQFGTPKDMMLGAERGPLGDEMTGQSDPAALQRAAATLRQIREQTENLKEQTKLMRANAAQSFIIPSVSMVLSR